MSELQDRVMAFMLDQDPDGIGDESMWYYIKHRSWFEDSLPHLLFALEVGVSFYDITNYLLKGDYDELSTLDVLVFDDSSDDEYDDEDDDETDDDLVFDEPLLLQ